MAGGNVLDSLLTESHFENVPEFVYIKGLRAQGLPPITRFPSLLLNFVRLYFIQYSCLGTIVGFRFVFLTRLLFIFKSPCRFFRNLFIASRFFSCERIGVWRKNVFFAFVGIPRLLGGMKTFSQSISNSWPR